MHISVVGAYLPRFDQQRLAEWIADDTASFQKTIRELRAQGVTHWTDEEIEQRAQEIPEELNFDLQRVALFEVEILGNTSVFSGSSFSEQKTTAASWEPVFLDLLGERVIFESCDAPASAPNFRIVFYIHDWPEDGVLVGPTGPLTLPPFVAVPERLLWKLAPYALID